MSNLVDYAKEELKRVRVDVDDAGAQDFMERNILQIIATFAEQGHSATSAAYLIARVQRLMKFLPLSPLTGEDDEWSAASSDGDRQNRRCFSVFKREDGTAYDIEAVVVSYDDGQTWHYPKQWKAVTFPYMPPDNPDRVLLPESEDPDCDGD